MSQPEEWFLIDAPDKSLCSGGTFLALASACAESVGVHFVRVMGLEVVWKLDVPSGTNADFTDVDFTMPLSELFRAAQAFLQVVWGYFFFLRDDSGTNEKRSILDDIRRSEFTVYAFDNMNFLVYTRRPELIAVVQKLFPDATISHGRLEELEHPG